MKDRIIIKNLPIFISNRLSQFFAVEISFSCPLLLNTIIKYMVNEAAAMPNTIHNICFSSSPLVNPF